MRDYEKVLQRAYMPEEAAILTLDTIKTVTADKAFTEKYRAVRDRYFAGAPTIEDIHKLAGEQGIFPHLLALAFTVMYTSRMRETYDERGIGEDIYYASLRDLTIWAKVCKRDFGGWGLREYDWMACQLRSEIFRLGRLQFHIIKYSGETFERAGRVVRAGDPVINMHIPDDGPLKREYRLDSYRRAYKFFGLDTFVCDSWLLYPKHTEFLPERSNILDFMRDFDIIRSDDNSEWRNLWRIWGRMDDYDPRKLPRDTGLRRAYADHLAGGGTTGDGFGVFFFDGENIVK